ncbi:MAG: T9SS type A sorting domain-containing protein, partial [Bacteroidetes bacterium]|nr:T9SS type A sorting domain-containing protein [Bacteroidota bacterium]
SGFINVKSDFNITSIELLSFTGKTVYTNSTIDSKTARINISNLSSGVYLMKVTTTKEILTRKITVTR